MEEIVEVELGRGEWMDGGSGLKDREMWRVGNE